MKKRQMFLFTRILAMILGMVVFVTAIPELQVFAENNENTAKPTIGLYNSTNVAQGESLIVSIWAEGADDVAALDISLFYDSLVFECENAYLYNYDNNVITNINQEIAGCIKYSLASVDGVVKSNGERLDIGYATLKVKENAKPGSTNINVGIGDAYDTNLSPVVFGKEGSTVTITEKTEEVQKINYYMTHSSDTVKGGTVIESVIASDLNGLSGGKFTILYDYQDLVVKEVRLGSMFKGDNILISVNKDTPGTIKISFASLDSLVTTDDKLMFEIEYDVLATANDSTVVSIKPSELIRTEGELIKDMVGAEGRYEITLGKKAVFDLYAISKVIENGYEVVISADELSGLAAADFEIVYDSSISKCYSVEADASVGANGGTLIANPKFDNGLIKFSFLNAKGISTKQDLVILKFSDMAENATELTLKVKCKNPANKNDDTIAFNELNYEIKKAYKVSDITGVLELISINEDNDLTGTIVPVEVADKEIIWSIKDAGTTGATITNGNKLKATTTGIVVITATVKNGIADGIDYTKDFNIRVRCKNKITYILDGGENNKNNPQEFWSNQEVILENPTKENYKFNGWYTDEGLSNKIDKVNAGIETDITLYAGWKLDRYKIVYELDGGKNHEDNVFELSVEDTLVLKPATKKGYTFDGWYTDKEFTQLIETVKQNKDNVITLYAKWNKISNIGDVLEEDIPEDGIIPDELWMSGLSKEGYIYTGASIKPEIRVYDYNKLLVVGKDCTIAYAKNINAGQATITVVGRGNYSGKIVETFTIKPRDINECSSTDLFVVANGRVQKGLPVVTAVLNGKQITLRKNTDYTLGYPDCGPDAYTQPGEYMVDITGKGNYTGTKTITETVAYNKTLISKVSVKAIPVQTYTGSEIEPVLTILSGKTELKSGVDYDVNYYNNTEIGTASVVVTGKGNYIGTKTVTFKIVGTAITRCTIDYTNAFIYSGSEICPDEMNGFRVYIKASATIPEKKLEQGIDYEVGYLKNSQVGTATMIITGINGYSGTLKKTFRINPFDITNVYDKRVTVDEIGSVTYQKGGAKPIVTVSDTVTGDSLVVGKDYTVTYVNNRKIHNGIDENLRPTVKITGRGNYKGTRNITFAIEGSDIATTKITATDFVYANRAGACKTVVTLTDSDGVKLAAGVDYDRAIVLTYAEDTMVKVAAIENRKTVYYDEQRTAGTIVDSKKDIIPAGTKIKATVSALKTGQYYKVDGENTKEVIFRCVVSDIGKAAVKIPAQTYTKSAITLSEEDITIAFGKSSPLKLGVDYEIVDYSNNINKGTAKVTLKGIGNYGGTKVASFSITQRSMNYTIIYDKNANDATGVMKNSSISTGTKLTRCAYKRTNDRFIGWNTKRDGSGISYNDCETFRLKSVFQIFGTTETLYAQWESGTQGQ